MSKAKKTRTRRANVTIDETTMLPDILQKLQKLTSRKYISGWMVERRSL
ncbi:hypothetical protein [Paenibacillus silviterrae]|nr:hypothetical protein [Paenibacillus chinjuensis]